MRKPEWGQTKPYEGRVPRIYHLPFKLAFETVVKAVNNIGYDIDNFNEQTGLITFHTGISWRTWAGQDMSVLVLEKGPSGTEIIVDGEKRWPFQIWDWGEVKAIAKKIFREFEALLQNVESGKAGFH